MARTQGAANYSAREERLLAELHEERARRKELEERTEREAEARKTPSGDDKKR